MRKDEMNSREYCRDCVEEEAAPDPDPNDTECCCCCCSCSESASESESNIVSTAMEQNPLIVRMEQRKKDLLSNLTILKTSQEQASIPHLLQYIEALTHSPDFLRRYNLQENFCLECLLSEPACTCCISGVSEMNLNDHSCDSCDECNRDESPHQQRYTTQGCSDCAAMQKAPISARPHTENRRERRRRRRRQRNIQHNLPRVSITRLSSRTANSSACLAPQNPSVRQTEAQNSVPLNRSSQCESSCNNDSCDDCYREETSRRRHNLESRRSLPQVNKDEVRHNNDRSGECCKEESFRRRTNSQSRRCSDFAGDSISEESDCCEECCGTNSTSSSCTLPGCTECENNKSETRGNDSNNEENKSYACCVSPSKESNFNKNSKEKKQDTSIKPEYNQNEACSECSDFDRDDSTVNCSCEECQENSECSEEYCNECKNLNTSEKKKKK